LNSMIYYCIYIIYKKHLQYHLGDGNRTVGIGSSLELQVLVSTSR